MNWPYLSNKTRAMLIIVAIWMHIAVITLVLALVYLFRGDISYWICGLICTIPVLFPLAKFVFLFAIGGYISGRRVWDINFTSDTHGTITHRGGLYALISALIGIALSILAGPFVLGGFIIYYNIVILRTLFAKP